MAAGSGGVLSNIRVVCGLRLRIQVIKGDRRGDPFIEQLLAHTHFFSELTGNQRRPGDCVDSCLIHTAKIIAMESTSGAEIKLGALGGAEDQTALGFRKDTIRRTGVGATVRAIHVLRAETQHRAKPLGPM